MEYGKKMIETRTKRYYKMDVKILQTILDNLITSSMREVRDDRDLLDSFSPNQFKSKLKL